jgi:transposase
MVDLVRSGRTPEELAREFEPTAQSISSWVKQDAGKRIDGPTSAEREEVGRLAERTGLQRPSRRARDDLEHSRAANALSL